MRYPTTSRAYASMHECSSNFNTNKYTVYYEIRWKKNKQSCR